MEYNVAVFVTNQIIIKEYSVAVFVTNQITIKEYNVAVFVTNQMTSDPGATMSFQADPKKPIGIISINEIVIQDVD